MLSKQTSKILSLLLAVCLVLGMIPLTAAAEAGGGSTHEHGEGCSYVEGAPCGYTHNHDEACGYDEESGEGCADVHEHGADCGYIEASACDHQHDASCGGLSLGDSGKTATPTNAIIVAAFDELPEETLYQGYDFDTVTLDDLVLPETLTGRNADGGALAIEGVTWQSAPPFDPAKEIAFPGYIFTPTLPDGYILAGDVSSPVISVFIRPEGGAQIQPMAVTGTLYINGASVTGLGVDANGTGWTWTAATDTLTLTSDYAGSYILINCLPANTINLVYSGNVTVDGGWANTPITCSGSLDISGSGGTLTATTTGQYGSGIISTDGNITISGSANVTASCTGTNGYGINAQAGDVTISTTGIVDATGGHIGIIGLNSVEISNGTVTTKGGTWGIAEGGTTITGGTITVGAQGGSNGNVYGDLTVNGATANVTVNGNITDGGNLTVSDGTVTVTGTVGGTTTHTGGMLNGQTVAPVAGGGATGTMDIGGTTVSDLTQNGNGTGWTWTAFTATLTLDSSYGDDRIDINCQYTDTINLVYTGNVSITSGSASTIYCKGNLNISESGSGGTLTITSSSSDSRYCALEIFGALTINSGTVNATCAGSGTNPNAAIIYGSRGVTISGSANVTANATGADVSGIYVEWGDITISTSGTVTANGNGAGGALAIGNGQSLNMSNGSLVLTGVPLKGNQFANLNIIGGSITIGGTQIYRAELTLSGVNTITAVTAVSAPASGYGISSEVTSDTGKLHFLLPAGNQTVTLTAGGNTYTGTVNVTTDHAATATLNVDGSGSTMIQVTVGGVNVANLTGNSSIPGNSGTGWAWDGSGAIPTLTLSTDYVSSNRIQIQCASTDTVNLVLAGDVEINGSGLSAIDCAGDLNISGSGKLTVKSNSVALMCRAGLTISGDVELVATGGHTTTPGSMVINVSRDLTINGNATVTANVNASATYCNGIVVYGNVYINTTGTVTANATGDGIALYAAGSGSTVNISNGTVALSNADNPGNLIGGTLNHTGGTINNNPSGSGGTTTEALLIAALQNGTASTITLGGNITLSSQAVSMGANHTLEIPATYTLTINMTGMNNRVEIGTHTLTINGGSNVTVNNYSAGFFTLPAENGTLNLENITANLQSGHGIQVKTVNVNSGATINLSAAGSADVIYLAESAFTLNVNAGGKINIQNFRDSGLVVGGTLNINGGEVTVGPGGGDNHGIYIRTTGTLNMTSGTLTGTSDGAIYLREGAKVEGMNGKLNDRGTTFTEAGQVIVGVADAAVSATGLSEGLYFWNGTLFAKGTSLPQTIMPSYYNVAPYSVGNQITATTNNYVANDGGAEGIHTFKWYRADDNLGTNASVINGATMSTYTPVAADFGKYICVETTPVGSVGLQGAPVKSNYIQIGVKLTAAATGAGGGTATVDGAASTVVYNTNAVNIAVAKNTATDTVAWSASPAVGNFGSTTAASTTYTPPAAPTGDIALTAALTASGGGPQTYTVTVTNGTASPTTAAAGSTVTITANAAPGGQRFKDWTITPSVTFTGGTSNNSQTATFTMPAQAVTATANYEALPAGTYSITVQTDGNGTANANVNSAQQGAQITLTSTPNSGYRFKEWQVIAGDVTITNNSFTMPDENVTVKAIFEQIPGAVTFTISYNANGGSGTMANGTVTQGGSYTIAANGFTRASHTFTGWNTMAGGNGTAYAAGATIPNVQDNITLYAQWNYNGGNSGDNGNGGGGGSSYTPSTSNVTTEKQPNMPTVAKQNVTGTIKDNTLSFTITEKMVKDATAAATNKVDGIAVRFDLTGTGYDSVTGTFNRAALEALKAASVKYVQFTSAVIDLTLDLKAVEAILAQTTGNVTVSAMAQDKLSDAARALIGSRPAFDITIKDGKGVVVSDLKGGAATIGIAYKPASGEKTGNLYGVYVDKNGRPTLLTNSSYDNGRLIFKRGSLSVYGVGYKAPAPAFTDISNHWAKDNIDFVASRDLISGTTATTFSPDTAITRATFLMALGKLSGADVSGYTTSSFTDVPNTTPAMPYIEWAVKNKIVQGIGDNKFGPDRLISRQDMAVMMVNYAKATGYTLPVSRQAVTFADNDKISAYAKDAVKAIQQAGIMSGKNNNLFDPQGNATRAEASTILRRFVELVIDEGTARGWVQNDAGQWQYINTNGKAVTGWLNTEANKYWFDDKGVMVSGKWVQISGKWYYFGADGQLAVNTTIDGYEVGADGARKQ